MYFTIGELWVSFLVSCWRTALIYIFCTPKYFLKFVSHLYKIPNLSVRQSVFCFWTSCLAEPADMHCNGTLFLKWRCSIWVYLHSCAVKHYSDICMQDSIISIFEMAIISSHNRVVQNNQEKKTVLLTTAVSISPTDENVAADGYVRTGKCVSTASTPTPTGWPVVAWITSPCHRRHSDSCRKDDASTTQSFYSFNAEVFYR